MQSSNFHFRMMINWFQAEIMKCLDFEVRIQSTFKNILVEANELKRRTYLGFKISQVLSTCRSKNSFRLNPGSRSGVLMITFPLEVEN